MELKESNRILQFWKKAKKGKREIAGAGGGCDRMPKKLRKM
jgi:hypothetical protein